MAGTTGVEIRPIRRDEAPVWRALRLEGLINHPEAFGWSAEEFDALSLSELTASIPAPGGDDILFGVYEDGALGGCAGFFRDTSLKGRHKGTLWGVYLRPALRGRGLGVALVDAVIAHAAARVELLKCVVNPENRGAWALYRSRGFATYGVEPRALRVNGRDQDDELMMLVLDRVDGL
jgi:ribosomal protein S18 acetylase RimI-like enzyme